MPRIVYVNGRYLPYARAAVHVEDRGLQFADSVYEVCPIRARAFLDERRHLDRLERSLAELAIAMPVGRQPLRTIMREIVAAERIRDGHVYIQVTRGVASRDHAFPVGPVRPGLIVLARRFNVVAAEIRRAAGVSVVTVPDTRWQRVDIKTTGLTANVMARQTAVEQGAVEAWFVDGDGCVTEGASSNAWIVTDEGELVTRAADRTILRGITRDVTLLAAERGGYSVAERQFTLDEALAAREAFLTSASNMVMPVVRIDGRTVGDGRPGPVAMALLQCFYETSETGPVD